MCFLPKLFSHSLLRIPKGWLPRLPTNCSPPTAMDLPGNRHSFPKRPVDPVDLKRFFQHFPFLAAPWSGWWVELWRTYEKTQQVATQQRLSLWRSCHGQLQGISSRLDHIDRRMLLSNKYGILLLTVITRPSPPLHIDLLYSCFTYLHLSMSFLVCLWLEGLAMSQSWLAFRGWVPIRIIFANPSGIRGKVRLLVRRWLNDQLEFISGATTMPKSFYS